MNLSHSKITANLHYFLVPHSSRIPLHLPLHKYHSTLHQLLNIALSSFQLKQIFC